MQDLPPLEADVFVRATAAIAAQAARGGASTEALEAVVGRGSAQAAVLQAAAAPAQLGEQEGRSQTPAGSKP